MTSEVVDQTNNVVINMENVDQTQDISDQPLELQDSANCCGCSNSDSVSVQNSSALENSARHSDSSDTLTSSKRKAFYNGPSRNLKIFLMACLFVVVAATVILTALAASNKLYPSNSKSDDHDTGLNNHSVKCFNHTVSNATHQHCTDDKGVDSTPDDHGVNLTPDDHGVDSTLDDNGHAHANDDHTTMNILNPHSVRLFD